MAIVLCGLSHRTAPLHTLERLSVPAEKLPKALAQLMDHDPIREGVILSTCNRLEIYVAAHRYHPVVEAVRQFISDLSGVPEGDVAGGMYRRYDTAAVRHLFGVAAGVDSMVVGEPQILGQVRSAFRAAAEEGTARHMLGSVFQRALRAGKRARSETGISRHVVSLPEAAVNLAAQVAGGLAEKRVLVVGAGEMGEIAARAAIKAGTKEVVVANRDAERARRLADALGIRSAGLSDLPHVLAQAEVVVAVTSSDLPVIDRDMLADASRDHRIVVVDIGVPRDVEPSARELPGVVLRDIDDLKATVDAQADHRRGELPRVNAIVDEEVEAFRAWERSLALGPAITELRSWAEQVRSDEVSRLAAGRDLDASELETLDRLTRGIVNKLLHRPMSRVGELVATDDGELYLDAFREIFDVDIAEADDE